MDNEMNNKDTLKGFIEQIGKMSNGNTKIRIIGAGKLPKDLQDIVDQVNNESGAAVSDDKAIRDMLSKIKGETKSQMQLDAENVLSSMSDAEKITTYTAAFITGCHEFGLDIDLAVAELAGLEAAGTVYNSMRRSSLMTDQEIKDVVDYMNKRFYGRPVSANTVPVSRATVNAMDLGDAVFSSFMSNNGMTLDDKILAASMALNNLLRYKSANK